MEQAEEEPQGARLESRGGGGRREDSRAARSKQSKLFKFLPPCPALLSCPAVSLHTPHPGSPPGLSHCHHWISFSSGPLVTHLCLHHIPLTHSQLTVVTPAEGELSLCQTLTGFVPIFSFHPHTPQLANIVVTILQVRKVWLTLASLPRIDPRDSGR